MTITFGERLKYALDKLNVSQSELGRRTGVSQQAIYYIIQNKLTKSKFAFKIADALGITPSWLIHGIGHFCTSFSQEVPIINSYIQLQKFLRDGQILDHQKYLTVEQDLGYLCFAFQTELTQVMICSEQDIFGTKEFLKVDSSRIEVVTQQDINTYPIYEIRRRCVEY